jgi:hypothetical protein
MNLSDLVVWGIGENDNPHRRQIVGLEMQRRIAETQIDAAAANKRTARYALISIIVTLISALVGWLISLHLILN